MITKKIYGTSVKKLNGKTIKRLEYDGESDGENMSINILQNGKIERLVIPERKKYHSFILPKIFHVQPKIKKSRRTRKGRKQRKKYKKKNKRYTRRPYRRPIRYYY
tara:strand:- start:2507 stop:2824 length:318 start_codon:yes stop_codon:yes gene_type:complete